MQYDTQQGKQHHSFKGHMQIYQSNCNINKLWKKGSHIISYELLEF